MNQAWHELIDLFDNMSGCYEQMIKLAEEKRDALVNVNVELVTQIISQEEKLVKQINILEDSRIKIVERIAREGSWTDKKIKLLDLVERAPEELAGEMKKVGQRLADIVMQIALLNGINNNLLKQAMHIIEYNINVLSRAQASPVYGSGGDTPKEGKNAGLSFLDRKA